MKGDLEVPPKKAGVLIFWSVLNALIGVGSFLFGGFATNPEMQDVTMRIGYYVLNVQFDILTPCAESRCFLINQLFCIELDLVTSRAECARLRPMSTHIATYLRPKKLWKYETKADEAGRRSATAR